MKQRMRWYFWVMLLISTQLTGTALAAGGKITVMNPRGIMPAIKRISMAPRADTLDGKTIYIVDTKFANTKPFVNAVRANLAAKYPNTTWIGVEKSGGYIQDDPRLWAEIKARAQGAIVLLGH